MPMTTRDGLVLQRLDVGQVLRRRSQFVVEEPRGLATVLLGRFGGSAAGIFSGVVMSKPALTMNLNQADLHAGGVEGLDDVLGVRPLLGGVGQQLQQRRLMGDERAHPSRMPGDQRQPRHRTAAGAEHVGGLGAEIVEDRGDVVGTRARGWSPRRGRRSCCWHGRAGRR